VVTLSYGFDHSDRLLQVFYWPAIFLAVVFVFLALFMEETNYNRKTIGIVATPGTPPPEETGKMGDEEKARSVSASSADHGTGEVCTLPKTFVQKLSIWQPSPGQNVLERAWRSLKYLGWPVIFYAGFSYGSYLIWFTVMNASASIILGGAPYYFKASMVGLAYVACCIGVVLGSLFAGTFSDWLAIKLARRNNGIMEAEHRLYPFISCVVAIPAFLVLWGVGAAKGLVCSLFCHCGYQDTKFGFQ
jgi:hypothetical protein